MSTGTVTRKRAGRPPKEITTPTPGVISAHELYDLQEFCSRMKWGRHAWRSARDAGLPVKLLANRRYIVGAAFLDWLRNQPDAGTDD